MTPDTILASVVRWVHIFSAALLAGGLFFLAFVLRPAVLEKVADEARPALHEAVQSRWRRVIMIAAALLIVSGLYNFMTDALERARGNSLYHALFGVKVLGALVVFFLASVLAGRSAAFQRLRARSGMWLAITLAIAAAVMFLGALLHGIG